MELKALTTEFCKLVGDGDIFDAVKAVLFSDRKNDVLAQYVKLMSGKIDVSGVAV